MKISAVFAVKDEAEYLPEALRSVAFCDDVVVVIDDRTTDATAAIATAAGARIFTRRFDGFASQKNYAIDQAKHDWVLIMDGDERVTPELRATLHKLEPARGTVAYQFAWRNYLGHKWLAHGGLYPDRHTRLIDRRHARYGQREIHELLEIDGTTETLAGDIIHLTYANTAAYYAKVMKYAREEANWTEVRPTVRSAVKEFAVRYVKLGGWRDGWAGLVSALLLAYYRLIVRWNMKERS
ncbi:MAG TPA: glycosyltransferase family 2 protein [Candidatus Saccharimonadia bacterium]|nr:glycosyltransferase family 2 protein [Candidatus Saccharimonadia bacterium]